MPRRILMNVLMATDNDYRDAENYNNLLTRLYNDITTRTSRQAYMHRYTSSA